MRLYHVTTTFNKASILRRGINPGCSQGARQECWYVTPGLLSWAILHVMQRKKVGLADVTALECLVPSRKLTRRRRGVYTCAEVVDPLFVVAALEAEGVAESYPVEVEHQMMQGG